jgi:histidine triad (HIT) family protein
MALTEEQAKSIKEQLFKQIESFPEDKREGIKSYVASLDNEKLEEFLIKNKLIKSPGESDGENAEGEESKGDNAVKGPNCIMCLIANKKIESFIVYEDKDYLAALEINPLSVGHTLLIPKEHIKDSKSLSKKAVTLANKIGKQLIKNLKAEEIQIVPSDELGHAMINIIPKYKDQKITAERKPAKKEELKEILTKIGKIEIKEKEAKEEKKETKDEVKKEEKKEEIQKSNVIKLPRRIP